MRLAVAADGYEQLYVVVLEKVEIEILLEVLVGGLETAHRQIRSALIEDIVDLEQIEILVTRIRIEQARIAVVQTYDSITLRQKGLRHTAHDRIDARCGTATCKNCNSLFHSIL